MPKRGEEVGTQAPPNEALKEWANCWYEKDIIIYTDYCKY